MDRSLEAVDKRIVIAVVDGGLTVKRLRIKSGRPSLEPENDRYTPIEIKSDMAFEIWGVITQKKSSWNYLRTFEREFLNLVE